MPRDGNYGPNPPVPAGAFERVCPRCGEEFRTDHPRQVYCSPACKRSVQNARAYRKHKRATSAMRRADELTDYGRDDPAEGRR
jgi:hypothetical protein